ncbi:MAG: signal recognition particle-docking protein FtsY [Deltaproteobacteria bacterium]|nr:signal recognition particle-docking protein FtsY [Deltaproteobacteria bacterium]
MVLAHLFQFPFPGLPVVALLLQIPLGGLAVVVEWNQRKKRAISAREPLAARRPEAARPRVSPAERPAAHPIERPSDLDEATAPPVEPSHPLVEPAPEPQREFPPEASRTEPQVSPPLPAEVDEAAALEAERAAAAEAERRELAKVQPAPELAPEATGELKQTPVEPQRRQPIPIRLGLRRTRENFLARIRAAITGGARVDEIYEGLEEALIAADVGVETSMKLVEAVRAKAKNDSRADVIRDALKEEMTEALISIERPLSDSSPLVIMMAGVNGVGKTTTVAKLAALLKARPGPVIVAAADTFRAAAIEQLQVWCDRVGVELIKQKQGSDPAAVAFDAVKAANARGAGAVIIDTAGRLQTKVNLMEELKKIARVVGREIPGAPHENWLVLDATTGQNALSQAKLFSDAVKLTGVVLAKLDSTAKGGIIVAIAERLKLPVRYVGLGEELEDLRPFDAREFVEALFSDTEDGRAAASGTYAA